MNQVPRSVLFGVALIAMSTLLLEVDITRIFAVTLWYYFGFVAISLALLGTAAAGMTCFAAPARWIGDRHLRYMGGFSVALAVLTPLVIAAHLATDHSAQGAGDAGFLVSLAFQFALFAVLFFCAGMVIAIALFRYNAEVGKVYAWDLVGASLGSALVIALLYQVSAPALGFAVSTAALLAAAAFLWRDSGRGTRAALVLLLAGSATLLVVNDGIGLLAVRTVKSYGDNSVQETEQGKVFEKWSPVSRVAVFEPAIRGRERMRVTNDAGAPTTLHPFNGDWSQADWTLGVFSNAPDLLRSKGDTLIIGSGGGLDVLSALRIGARSVTAVEINPVIAEIVTDHYADYIGRIFQDPRVTLHVQEGRNFAAGSPDRYDLIKITMIDSWAGAAAGAYMFSENTLYTQEAVRDYYQHLRPDGILAITRYLTWDEALRVLNTYLEYLDEIGVTGAGDRIAIVAERSREKYWRATLMLRNGAFTAAESAVLAENARLGGATLIYAPGRPQAELAAGEYFDFMRRMLAMSSAERRQTLAGYPRDVSPSTDDRPFFFFMERFSNLLEHDTETFHAARRLALPILYGAFAILAVLAVLTIFGPLWLRRRDLSIREAPRRTPVLAYFAGIGVGFMLIEISLIHRLTVFLGHPTYSFVVVLATLLLASGVGSALAHRYAERIDRQRLLGLLGGIVALALLTAATLYDRLIDLMWLPFGWRLFTSVVLLVPIGLLLGTCFPIGIRLARRSHEHLVPWAWAVNGVFSVFASAASLVIAMNLGLKAMLMVGAICYLLNMWVVARVADTAGDLVRLRPASATG
jgi:hypothetical protein